MRVCRYSESQQLGQRKIETLPKPKLPPALAQVNLGAKTRGSSWLSIPLLAQVLRSNESDTAPRRSKTTNKTSSTASAVKPSYKIRESASAVLEISEKIYLLPIPVAQFSESQAIFQRGKITGSRLNSNLIEACFPEQEMINYKSTRGRSLKVMKVGGGFEILVKSLS